MMPPHLSSAGVVVNRSGENGVEAGMSPWQPDFVGTLCGEEEPAGVENGDGGFPAKSQISSFITCHGSLFLTNFADRAVDH